jgi:hypothetical protein
MRTCLFIVFIISSNLSIAQDFEFPDYRSKREVFKTVLEKDIRSDIASFSYGGLDESIGKLPLKTIPITSAGKDFISFEGNGIQVNIKAAPFDAKKHKLGYYDNKYLVKIDNKAYFGDYGKVPKSYIESVTVVVDNDTVPIPPAAFADLYNPVLSVFEGGVQKSSNKVYLSNDGRKIYIYMVKQEAGGSYESTWVIQDKKYMRRVVDFGFLK